MIEKLADLVSPILLPMGVSYADILFYLNAISNYLLIGLAALVILVAVLIAAVKVKKGYKLFARGQAIVAFLACLVILVNAVCYGPLAQYALGLSERLARGAGRGHGRPEPRHHRKDRRGGHRAAEE